MPESKENTVESCKHLGVIFLPHKESARMKVAGAFHWLIGNRDFLKHTVITQCPYIFHPDSVEDMLERDWRLVAHELVHWRQQKKYGTACWTTKYLASWKFRWEQERWAYLKDIKTGRCSLHEAAKALRVAPYWVKLPEDEIVAFFVEWRSKDTG